MYVLRYAYVTKLQLLVRVCKAYGELIDLINYLVNAS